MKIKYLAIIMIMALSMIMMSCKSTEPAPAPVEPVPAPVEPAPKPVEPAPKPRVAPAMARPVDHPAAATAAGDDQPAVERKPMLVGIPIEGPSKPVPEPEPEEETVADRHFYRPEPRNVYTPTPEQIEEATHRPKRHWLWILLGAVAVGALVWLLARGGGEGKVDEQQPPQIVAADTLTDEQVQQIEMEKEYNQFCQEKQLTRDTSVEAYFALQLVYLMDACFKGLDRRLDRAQSAVKSKSNDLDLLGTVKLSLNCGTTDREEVNQEFKAKVGFFKSQSLFSKIDWKSISEIFSQISNNSWKEMSFRQYQLVCICLQLLICIQMFIDVEGFLLSNSEDDPIVLLIKTLGQVFKNLETIEKESLYEQTEDEIKRRVNEAIEAPQLGYDENDDITAMTAKIQLRKTMEKVFAYLSIQVVFQDNKSEDDRNEWVFLRQFTDIMEKERLKNTSISSTKQSLERYLAYSLCPKDENTIWLMPELRLEGSRGQLNMLMLAADLSWIFDGKNSITQNCPNLLLIDEADLAYHPEWQRTFLFWLLSLLHGFDSTVWHVMIATHSPILISDFPRSNIIRLNNEITDNQTDRLNTFAQNIYAIYQSEMHLNTAVGEFARQYMQQIINTINEMETKGCDTSKTYEKVERMIKRIGDPMLKKAYLTRLDKARAKNITDVLIKEMKEKGFEEDKMDYLKRLVESRQ